MVVGNGGSTPPICTQFNFNQIITIRSEGRAVQQPTKKMKTNVNYANIVATYGNIKKEERTLEGAFERLTCMANTAMQLKQQFINQSTIWWTRNCYKEAVALLDKEIRTSKDGSYPVFYVLQFCIAVEKALEKKGFDIKVSYSSYKKSKKNFNFSTVTVEELTKQAAKERVAAKKIAKANK